MNYLIGLFLSFFLLFILLVIGQLTKKFFPNYQELGRKVIHIGVGYWWFIAMHYFDNVYIAIIPPFIYLILNTLAYKFNLVKIIQSDDRDDIGIIYYPLSLLILVIFTFGIIKQPLIGAVGIMILANGDGLAAIIGRSIKTKTIYKNKTVAGTLTMYIVSFIVVLLISLINHSNNLAILLIIVPIIATLLELYSLKDTDNLSVPIISTCLFYLITLL
jgi:phytol kinase